MAGLTWIEIDTDLPEHKKSLALGLRLNDRRAWTHMAELFLWCARNNPTGRFEGEEAVAMLCHASGWQKEAGVFVSAAESVGFLDREEDGTLVVHDLAERLAAHIALRKKNAKRQKDWRKRVAKRYGNVTRDVTVTEPAPNRDVEGNTNTNTNSNDQKQLPCTEASPSVPQVACPGWSEPGKSDAAKANPAGGGKSPAPPKPKTEDPRKAEKRAAYERIFREVRGAPYYWQGPKDQGAVNRLLAIPLDEWERRARLGLTTTDYNRKASTVAQLGMKWNDLAGTGPPPGAKRTMAAVGDWSDPVAARAVPK